MCDDKEGSLSKRLPDFFEHVLSHPTEGVRTAFCLVAHDDTSGDKYPEGTVAMHVCTLFGGDAPEDIVQLLMAGIEEISAQVPGFREAWINEIRARAHAERLKALLEQTTSAIAEAVEAQQLKSTKPVADELIARAKKLH